MNAIKASPQKVINLGRLRHLKPCKIFLYLRICNIPKAIILRRIVDNAIAENKSTCWVIMQPVKYHRLTYLSIPVRDLLPNTWRVRCTHITFCEINKGKTNSGQGRFGRWYFIANIVTINDGCSVPEFVI